MHQSIQPGVQICGASNRGGYGAASASFHPSNASKGASFEDSMLANASVADEKSSAAAEAAIGGAIPMLPPAAPGLPNLHPVTVNATPARETPTPRGEQAPSVDKTLHAHPEHEKARHKPSDIPDGKVTGQVSADASEQRTGANPVPADDADRVQAPASMQISLPAPPLAPPAADSKVSQAMSGMTASDVSAGTVRAGGHAGKGTKGESMASLSVRSTAAKRTAKASAKETGDGQPVSANPEVVLGTAKPAASIETRAGARVEQVFQIAPTLTPPTASHAHMQDGAELKPGAAGAAMHAGTDQAAPVSDLKTLVATPNVLEIGIACGSHGWLRVRAELGRTGDVSTAILTATQAAAEGLHRELPAISAYLAKEQMGSASLSINAAANATAEDTLASGTGRSSDEGSRRESSNRDARSGPETGPVDRFLRPAMGMGQALSMSLASADTGSWLSVRA